MYLKTLSFILQRVSKTLHRIFNNNDDDNDNDNDNNNNNNNSNNNTTNDFLKIM